MLLRGGESCGGAKLDPGTHLDRFSVKNYTQSVEYQLLRRQDAKVGKIDNLSSRCPKVSQRCPKGVPQGGYACPFRGTWYGLVLVWGGGGGPGGVLNQGKGLPESSCCESPSSLPCLEPPSQGHSFMLSLEWPASVPPRRAERVTCTLCKRWARHMVVI